MCINSIMIIISSRNAGKILYTLYKILNATNQFVFLGAELNFGRKKKHSKVIKINSSYIYLLDT